MPLPPRVRCLPPRLLCRLSESVADSVDASFWSAAAGFVLLAVTMLPAAGNTAVATLDAIVLLLFWFWLEFGNTAVVAGPPGGDCSCWPAVTDCAEVLETFVQVEEGVVVLVPTRLLLLLLAAAATCATAGPVLMVCCERLAFLLLLFCLALLAEVVVVAVVALVLFLLVNEKKISSSKSLSTTHTDTIHLISGG